MTIRCIIVDDEQPARDELRYLLSSYADVDIAGEADSAGNAIELIRNISPDLVFLDIQMPGKNGFEVVTRLRNMQPKPLFVFATAYDHYAVKAFEESAVDYIMKPFSQKRLDRTIERIRGLLSAKDKAAVGIEDTLQLLLAQMDPPKEPVRLSVEKNGRILLLTPEEIIYCSYDSGTIFVHTSSERYSIHAISTMDRLADHLSRASFFRAHRSLLVNLDRIREFSPWFNGKYNLVMDDAEGTELTISRTRVKEFKKRIGI